MKTVFIILIYAVVHVPVVMLMGIIPYVTRKTESFGVRIPLSVWKSTEIKKIRTQYRNIVIALGMIIVIPSFLISLFANETVMAIVFCMNTPLLYILMFVTYLQHHKKMKILKSRSAWAKRKKQLAATDTRLRQKKSLVSPLWFILYFLVILGTIVCSYVFYDMLPQKIPLQYDVNGRITGWIQKTPTALLFAPLLQIFITVIMVVVYFVIAKAKTQVDAVDAEVSAERNRRFRYAWSAFTVFMGLALLLVFGFMLYAHLLLRDPLLVVLVPLGVVAGILIAAFVLIIRIGQGGSRIRMSTTKDGKIIERDDDKYWKLGIFYYNKDDPALFVEKRFGVGWTCNFAKPAGWVLFFGVLVGLPLLILVTVFLL